MSPEAICSQSGEKVVYSRRHTLDGKPVFDEEGGLWACDCSLSGICELEDDIWQHEIKETSPEETPKDSPLL